MSTGSSKSRRSRQTSGSKTRGSPGKSSAKTEIKPDISDRASFIISILILLVGAFLRLYDLTLVPLHHDEGVNGNFLVRLVREGAYQYDPQNYHGPSLYYFSAVIPWVLRFLFGVQAQDTYGLNTVTIRLVTAMFGLGTIYLILTLRRLGAIGALCGAALLAVSPGAVYLSRYFIHESLFVFFTLGVIVAGLRYYEDGHPVYLILASACAALLFATKETFIINGPVLLIALFVTGIYLWLRGRESRREGNRFQHQKGLISTFRERLRDDIERLGGITRLAMLGAIALSVFIAIAVLFYSSFFTNYPKGVIDSLKTFQIWTRTGQTAHVHPRWKYVEWLYLQERPLLFLGIAGAAIAFWRAKNSFAVFSAFWAFGTLAAYSLVPYKTPWIGLNFIVPLAVVAGYAVQSVYEANWGQLRAVVAIMLLAIGVSVYQTIDLNFRNYDNDDSYYVYVYAHTRRETLKMVDEISRIARLSGEGGHLGVTIVSPDYWPLPWYLRDYSRVGYYGRMAASNEPVIIASEAQRAEVQATFGERYRLTNSGLNSTGSYSLRPGVDLLLMVRRDISTK